MEQKLLNDLERVILMHLRDAPTPVSQDALARLRNGASPLLADAMPRDQKLRTVRRVVRDLRVTHGIPVLSNNKGYWIARNRAEVKVFVDDFYARAKASAASYFATVKSLQQYLPSDYQNQNLFTDS